MKHRSLKAMLATLLLTCTIGATAGAAYADPSMPTSVNNWYGASEGQVDLFAYDGLADEAWNVAFEVDGTNGTFWVQGVWDINCWTCSIPVSQIGIGPWSATAMANIASEPVQVLGSTAGYVRGLYADPYVYYDDYDDFLCVYIDEVSCPTGVQAVSAGITSPSGITMWLPLQYDGASWCEVIDPYEFGYEPGLYTLEIAIADDQWQGISLPAQNMYVKYGYEDLGTNLTDSTMTLWCSGQRASKAWNVAFYIDGSNGPLWIQGNRIDADTWEAQVDPATIGNGSFTLQAMTAVASYPVTSSEPMVVPNSIVDAFPSIYYEAATETLNVTFYNPMCFIDNVEAISVGITAPDGTNAWFPVRHEGVSEWWIAEIPADTFDYMSGIYAIDVAVADTNWNVYNAGHYTSDPYESEFVSAVYDLASQQFYIIAGNGRAATAWNAAFKIDASTGTRWLQAQPEDSVWTATLPEDLEDEFRTSGLPTTTFLNIDELTLTGPYGLLEPDYV